MIVERNPSLVPAKEKLDVIIQDEQMRMAYTSRLKAVMDYNTIKEESLNRGIEKGMDLMGTKTDLNMLRRGRDTYEEISDMTGIPVSKIKEIATTNGLL